jgi:hypothetical protein
MKMMVWLGGLLLLAQGAWALDVPQVQQVRASLQQGGFYVGRTMPGAKVRFDGTVQTVDGKGFFILGFDRDAAPEQSFKVCAGTPEQCASLTLLVEPRTYKVQPIKGVAGKHVNPDPKQVAQMAADSKAITAARSQKNASSAFAGMFARPIDGDVPITGVYGSGRSYNGELRSWHKGADFAAPTGTPVLAPADGTVSLARFTFMNGNLVILDHGQNLYTIYAHLDAMDVKAGEKVATGEVIGKVGTTGRSTGPHLHWGVYWRQMALDPLLFL